MAQTVVVDLLQEYNSFIFNLKNYFFIWQESANSTVLPVEEYLIAFESRFVRMSCSNFSSTPAVEQSPRL